MRSLVLHFVPAALVLCAVAVAQAAPTARTHEAAAAPSHRTVTAEPVPNPVPVPAADGVASRLPTTGLRLIRSDASGLELEWTMPVPRLETVTTSEGTARRPVVVGGLHTAEPGRADLPSLLRLVGIPGTSLPRLEVLGVATEELALPDMAPAPGVVNDPTPDGKRFLREVRAPRVEPVTGMEPTAWAEFRGTSTVRSQRVVRLAIHPCKWDAARGTLVWARSLRLRLTFDATEAARSRGPVRAEHADWEGVMQGTLLNADVARQWRIPAEPLLRGGTEDSFDRSANWIRFPILETGVYRVDYFTFANLGVDPASVDPRTIRVFAGTNLPLEENLVTPSPDFMTECALKDLGDGDGVFDLDDRFLVWAHSPFGWASEFDATRSRTEHVENEYGDHSYYWLTWGGDFAASPKRMAQRSVVDTTFTGGAFPRSTPHRLHFEQNNTESFAFPAEDGWMWEDLRGRGRNRLYELVLPSAASGAGVVSARVYSHNGSGRIIRRVEVKLTDQVTQLRETIGSWEWRHGPFSAVFDVTGCTDALLVDGVNRLSLNADFNDAESIDHVFTGWFDVEYDRALVAEGGRHLHFFTDTDSLRLPSAPSASALRCLALPNSMRYGQSAFRLTAFDSPGSELHLFDVTDQHDVVDLTEFSVMNPAPPHDIRFSDPGGTGTRWYAAVSMTGVRTLPAGEFASIRGLRDPANRATYLIIYHPDFEAGAEELAEVRGRDGQFTTLAVSADDIYQEFGWGMRDPVAVRDFLAMAQRWQLSPLYVVLMGDAVFDTKGNLSGSPPDLVSTYTRRYREAIAQYDDEENIDFYSTDDFFGYLDADDYTPPNPPALDIAIGRVPVANTDELDVFINKVESYLKREMPGQWQNRVILVADDERILQESAREKFHTEQVETLARERYPNALDRVKIYLVDFPRNDFGKKPEAQEKYIEEFTRGALMVTYTGHGDQNTMAQEEVFVSQKVSELQNEQRYTVFSTFSCQVSRFDLLSGDSMTELMLKLPGGGVVTTFASGGLVFPFTSATLNQEWLGAMFGTPQVVGSFSRAARPIGLAGLASKVVVGTTSVRKNNEKYVLLGDPALVVRFGAMGIDFQPTTVDVQAVTDHLRVIRGQVRNDDGQILDGTSGTTPFTGTAWIHVTEDADTTGYNFLTFAGAQDHIDFTLEGATVYRGQVPVVDGEFDVRFYLSEGVRAGNKGRISVFSLESGGLERDASGAYDQLVLAPTLSPSQVNDDQGPRLAIRFEGYEQFVSGDLLFTDQPVLTVDVVDPSGVNLRPFPQFARLEAELDDKDRLDLAPDFSFDLDSFTEGKVRTPMSLTPGQHSIKVKAFDNVGNRGEAEVKFSIVLPEADFDLVDRVVTAYPNPFQDRVDVVFQLTHDAEVKFKVFTVTGREIYEGLPFSAVRGANVISWTGEDDHGTPLANGTYLYKLEATHVGDDEADGSSDEYVGKIVRMR